jgi:rod shape-determining protein MreB
VFHRPRIAIDLGTANTLVHAEKRGIVTNEPSVIAVSHKNKILAVGNDAKKMLGKAPDKIKVYRPLKDGVISNYNVTLAMIKYFMIKAIGRWNLLKPDMMICVPSGITSTERRAVIDAGKTAGANRVFIIKEPLAAAIGATIPIAEPTGNMVIDIGGGTSEIAIISLGGIVAAESARIGGDHFNAAIKEYIRKSYNLDIGENTAEKIKKTIGNALYEDETPTMHIRGRSVKNGLPEMIEITGNDITRSFHDQLEGIVTATKRVLEVTPAELSADIIDHGIVMTGGGALLKNIDIFVSQKIGVPCFIADDPLLCVARGTGAVIDNMGQYELELAMMNM